MKLYDPIADSQQFSGKSPHTCSVCAFGDLIFLCPSDLSPMEACLILALILAARYIWKYPVASWHDTPLFKPAALFAVLAFISLPDRLSRCLAWPFICLRCCSILSFIISSSSLSAAAKNGACFCSFSLPVQLSSFYSAYISMLTC